MSKHVRSRLLQSPHLANAHVRNLLGRKGGFYGKNDEDDHGHSPTKRGTHRRARDVSGRSASPEDGILIKFTILKELDVNTPRFMKEL